MPHPLYAEMKQSIIDGDPDASQELARKALAAGLDPLESIQQGYLPGMQQVGREFGDGQLFLPDVVLAAEAMKRRQLFSNRR